MALSDLIQALTIMSKYGNPAYPTHCEHDELIICGIHPAQVSSEDRHTLYDLGFFVDEGGECFRSFRYGSA